ncbi:MAG: FAD-binding protein [Alphaproteobacteria bacterium]
MAPSPHAAATQERLSGWGRFPRKQCILVEPRTDQDWIDLVTGGDEPVIARGAGRAYGDSALGTGLTLSTRYLDRILDFDPATGLLAVEAGAMLGNIVDGFLPEGWLPPVLPGTRHVTVGGMVAADVHGKNHHGQGSFGRHVAWLDLLEADGTITRCSPTDHGALFHATVGGMGLTGIVLRVAFRMIPVRTAWMQEERVLAADLDATMASFEASDNWAYSVAWIDCVSSGRHLGRSVLYRANHAQPDALTGAPAIDPLALPGRRSLRVPMDGPSWMLQGLTMRAFNAAYYRMAARSPRERLVDCARFFHPLDGVIGWNRLYGPRGFVQFQCVLPTGTATSGLRRILETTARAGQGSFLAVLKRFGAFASAGTGLSFTAPGYTLCLDFPATPERLSLLEGLDRIVLDHGGRFYLAKDARMDRGTFHAAERDRLPAFQRFRRETGASERFQSHQSARLGL